MLWEVDIHPAPGQPDPIGQQVAAEIADLGFGDSTPVASARGYLIQGELAREQVELLAAQLLADGVVERTVVAPVDATALLEPPVPLEAPDPPSVIHVLPKPGVMDPVAMSAKQAIADFGIVADEVRTLKKYWIAGDLNGRLSAVCSKVLANDAIEQAIVGPLGFEQLEVGSPYQFELITVPIGDMDDEALGRLSIEGQLYLSLVEMQTIQRYFQSLGRDPTDAELETVAQTWSEHCSHKTLAGRIDYRDDERRRHFDNMLKETIFAATTEVRRQAGAGDWCVSVFKDNAGIVRFDDEFNVVFKVETHNHPSALEPYGGANTGIGGVIRDPMGTGMGAKPIANTDVFCFAPPDWPADELPPGVLHPRRVMRGVVSGVRDYGNRMGIPTVNGAVYFDRRYLGNPLVYCGNVGIIPRDKSEKEPKPGDLVVAVGGRTGRDGIHGATFSSAELTSQSESVSGGAVQIGNAITEKMMLDVLLEARDRGLYNAVTDCGAGGFSSAVGEMGAEIGAEVWLERVPLKYEGLSYTEIWISEAQERMTLAVPADRWEELRTLCEAEGVEAIVIGQFKPTGRLVLKYGEHQVADLDMDFLHNGRPPVIREAVYQPPPPKPQTLPQKASANYTDELMRILGSLNVASKHWIIRQYDHEVQAGSVVKPLVGAENDGPSDAAVVRPRLDSYRGLAIACGMNPHYGDLDTYWMAASAIDEAIRNCVAVGADPRQTALLDNFCWGNTERPETLGSLVRAALACHEVAVVLGTPFISGKDSLNNEFRPDGGEPIAIPPSLLISAMGQIDDVRNCVTMDLKPPGTYVYQVGRTSDELGGSHFALVEGLDGGQVPRVDAVLARKVFEAMHGAIGQGLVHSCHDLSEGGLAVAAAEMAFAGGWGVEINLAEVPHDLAADVKPRSNHESPDSDQPQAPPEKSLAAMPGADALLLFSESNTRFLCEVAPERAAAFEAALEGVPFGRVGRVIPLPRLQIAGVPRQMAGQTTRAGTAPGPVVVDAGLEELKSAWQKPLDW